MSGLTTDEIRAMVDGREALRADREMTSADTSVDKDALIRELVAALAAVGDQNTYDARRVLAKAKAAGYEP